MRNLRGSNGLWRRIQRRSRASSTARKRARLAIEPLEHRQLLAGLWDGSDDTALLGEGEAGGPTTNASGNAGEAFGEIADETFYLPPQEHLFSYSNYLTGPSTDAVRDVVRDYLFYNGWQLGMSAATFDNYSVTDQYVSSQTDVTHLYLQQTYNGLDVANARINANVTDDGQLINVGGGFVLGLTENNRIEPALTASEALASVAAALELEFTAAPTPLGAMGNLAQLTVFPGSGISTQDIPANLEYVPRPDGGVELAWNFKIDVVGQPSYYNVSASAEDGEVIYLTDWTRAALYNVFPLPIEHPEDGDRQIVTDPALPNASPFGWHDADGVAGADYTDTRGNNVFAQEDRDDDDGMITEGFRPDGGVGLNFDFPLDLNQEPKQYEAASITNLFYLNNILHDIHFQYGFDEVSGNFQRVNYSGQGKGNDAVRADAQDASEWEFFGFPMPSYNNAYMTVTPDGEAPNMAMFLWDDTMPLRDGDLSNMIVTHEYGHGVSTRVTGGPSFVDGLWTAQGGGMGEGWGDWWGLMFTQKSEDLPDDPRTVGTYVQGEPADGPGIRDWPYSFDMTINPLTYGRVGMESWPDSPNPNGAPGSQAHNAGQIWASTLWGLNWILINKYGFEPDISKGYSPDDFAGNTLALRLIMDGLKLQPSTPSFLDARDAILLADLSLTGGENMYDIWDAFARRGMGYSSDDGGGPDEIDVIEAFDVPVPADISGTVWFDANANGALDGDEPGLEGWAVVLDLDNSGTNTPGDVVELTDENGAYTFPQLFPNTYNVLVDLLPGWIQTYPADNGGYFVQLPTGQDVGGLNFGIRAIPGSVRGTVWNDLDQDGIIDPDEPGQGGLMIYVDVDGNGLVGLGEPQTVSGSDGTYKLDGLMPGIHAIRQVDSPGWPGTSPAGGVYTVDLSPDEHLKGYDFLNYQSFDYGDAPTTYPTLRSQNGPVHGYLEGFYLGTIFDGESDAAPDVFAKGDDFTGTNAGADAGADADGGILDDEDGIDFSRTEMVGGQTASVLVTVTHTAPANGYLQGWIDFNGDGDWDDAGEQIFRDRRLQNGTNELSFLVPNSLVNGRKYARFRYGVEQGLSYDGPSLAGEVEDYSFALGILPGDDGFNVVEDSRNNVLDVLANDATSTATTLRIIGAGNASNGGSVQVSADEQNVLYTPAPDFWGIETFTYVIADETGGSDVGLVTVTVSNTNDDPTAAADRFTVIEGTADNELNVLANDTWLPDPEETLRVIDVSAPSKGGTARIGGGGGSVIYTPPADMANDTETFIYTIEDGNGGIATATITTIVTVNSDPTAYADVYTVEEDSVDNLLNVLANDSSYPDVGETLSVMAVNILPVNGTARIAPDGQGILYTPNADYFGTEVFAYLLSDGHGGTGTATVSVTVTSINDVPIANADGQQDEYEVNEDETLAVPASQGVLANDEDVETPNLTAALVRTTANGRLSLSPNGSFTYTPDPDFNGFDSFTYAASDGDDSSEAVDVRIRVIALPEPLVVGSNVNVSQSAGNQHTPSLAVDPNDPDNRVIVANTDGDGIFAALSTDGGATWGPLSGADVIIADAADQLPNAAGDPDVAWDEFGNLFIAYVAQDGQGVVILSTSDFGQTYSGTQPIGTNPASAAANPSVSVGGGSVWVTWVAGTNNVANAAATVTGTGTVSTFNIVLPSAQGGTVDFPTTAIGPAGQAAFGFQQPADAAGPSVLWVGRDVDAAGPTPMELTIYRVSSTEVGGVAPIPAQPDYGINAGASLAYGPNGRLYMAYADAPSVGSTDTDVYVRYSDNDGQTWTDPVRVNDDVAGASQFLPSIAVDQATGRVGVAWYDTRNSGAGTAVDVYASASVDSGATFHMNVKVTGGMSNQANSPPTGGAADVDFGDHISVAMDNGILYVAWTDNSNSTGDNPDGGMEIHTAEIDTSPATIPALAGNAPTSAYSNPNDEFDVNNDGFVSPIDALLIINSLNVTGPRQLAARPTLAQLQQGYFDVNGDLILSPIDALLIINALNRKAVAEGQSAADPLPEGEPPYLPPIAPGQSPRPGVPSGRAIAEPTRLLAAAPKVAVDDVRPVVRDRLFSSSNARWLPATAKRPGLERLLAEPGDDAADWLAAGFATDRLLAEWGR